MKTNPFCSSLRVRCENFSSPMSYTCLFQKASKVAILCSLALAGTALISQTNAQVIASDPASNYTSGTWTNNANLGTGFGGWYIAGSPGTGGFNGAIIDAGSSYSNYGPIRTSGVAYAIYAGNSGTGAFQDAGRAFSTPLQVGDIFTLSLGFSFDNGNKGLNLYSDNLTSQVFNFNINNAGYSWTGGGSAPMTSWVGLRENGVVIDFSFTKTGTGFNYSFSSLQDANLTQSGSITASGVESFKFYVSDAGGGEGGNLYFNDLQVVPEPSTYALLALSAMAVGAYSWRRRLRRP